MMKIAAKLFVLVGFAFALNGCADKVSAPKNLEGIDFAGNNEVDDWLGGSFVIR